MFLFQCWVESFQLRVSKTPLSEHALTSRTSSRRMTAWQSSSSPAYAARRMRSAFNFAHCALDSFCVTRGCSATRWAGPLNNAQHELCASTAVTSSHACRPANRFLETVSWKLFPATRLYIAEPLPDCSIPSARAQRFLAVSLQVKALRFVPLSARPTRY